jgi:hypothetical protein
MDGFRTGKSKSNDEIQGSFTAFRMTAIAFRGDGRWVQ